MSGRTAAAAEVAAAAATAASPRRARHLAGHLPGDADGVPVAVGALGDLVARV